MHTNGIGVLRAFNEAFGREMTSKDKIKDMAQSKYVLPVVDQRFSTDKPKSDPAALKARVGQGLFPSVAKGPAE